MTDVSSRGPDEGDERAVLTNRQGHPVYDNQNQRTVGPRDVTGPTMTHCVPDARHVVTR